MLGSFIISLIAVSYFPYAQAFFFYWTTNTAQCGTYELSWANGTSPFTAVIIPIFGQPFYYDIPDSAYTNNFGRYPITLQLTAGTSYVILMSDAEGTGTGGSSQVVRVQVSNETRCLYTAGTNATDQDFSFSVSGVAKQCQRGFELAWTRSTEQEPYNFTVVPLDQSFRPYDVALEEGVSSMSDWQLNMTQGTRFTVMMNDRAGYGRGGVGGIYEVAAGSDADCVVQSLAPTGSWPLGLATNTLPPATLIVTQRQGSGSPLSGGAIAGVVIGALAAVVIAAVALWFLLRRKRRRRVDSAKLEGHQVDLVDATDDSESRRRRSVASNHSDSYHRLDPFTGGHAEVAEDNGTYTGTMTSAGIAGLGAGIGVGATQDRHESMDENDRPSGPGVAGPLPAKIGPSPPSPVATTTPAGRPPSIHSNTLKNDVLGRASTEQSPLNPQQNGQQLIHSTPSRSMRVINHDDPTRIPAVVPPTTFEERRARGSGPTYRRHEDAGRIPIRGGRNQEEVVDLPPLYTDVPRDDPYIVNNSDLDESPVNETVREYRR